MTSLNKILAQKAADFSNKSFHLPTQQEADSWLNWLRKLHEEREVKRKEESKRERKDSK